ncbi:hypothetical protein EZ437_18905 [Pedobacter psychroterrae]|uniref:Uncharacterized protein n=1 Tax=Pedobacter psychroterrae TaxID=2530453 RepID=A0A4R0NG94_9SPHI|nr:hypothetical protein EZ437_18905 [Pedobacter psychroterrae]
MVSFGTLSQAETASVTAEKPLTITVKWAGGDVGNMQKAMILLYDIAAGAALIDTSAAWRQNKIFEWILPAQFESKKYHVYLAFVDSDMSNQSTSQYLGEVTVL